MTWMPQAVDWTGLRCGYSRPSITIRPSGSGRSTPAMTLMRVDLPDPFSPTRQWTSPAGRDRSTLRNATTPPKRFEMACRSRKLGNAGAPRSKFKSCLLRAIRPGRNLQRCQPKWAGTPARRPRSGVYKPPAMRPSMVSLLMRMILSTLISLPGTSTEALPSPGISMPSFISVPSSTRRPTATIA